MRNEFTKVFPDDNFQQVDSHSFYDAEFASSPRVRGGRTSGGKKNPKRPSAKKISVVDAQTNCSRAKMVNAIAGRSSSVITTGKFKNKPFSPSHMSKNAVARIEKSNPLAPFNPNWILVDKNVDKIDGKIDSQTDEKVDNQVEKSSLIEQIDAIQEKINEITEAHEKFAESSTDILPSSTESLSKESSVNPVTNIELVSLSPKNRVLSPSHLACNKILQITEVEKAQTESSFADKSKASGISTGTLKKVYQRGEAAWKTGHRPGTTPSQWGHARVNAFIAKKKKGNLNHDKDLA